MNAEFFALAFTAALNPKLLAIDLLLIENRGPAGVSVWRPRERQGNADRANGDAWTKEGQKKSSRRFAATCVAELAFCCAVTVSIVPGGR